MREFYWGYINMWLRWIRPTSPFVASISFIAMIGGLLTWLITKWMGWPDASQSISFIVFIIGLSGSIIMLIFVAPYEMWKEAAPDVVKEQKQNAKQYVFPYIRSISASPVIDANERYLSLSVFFPTSLVKELELKPSIQLILNGSSSEKVQINKIKVSWRYVSRLTALHIPLTQQMLNIVQQAVKDNIPVRATLKIDTENPEYSWETEEWTTLLLTRLN